MKVARALAMGCVLVAGCSSGEDGVGARSDDLRDKPRYTVDSEIVLGTYSSTEGCAGGFDICEDIEVRRTPTGLEVKLGHFDMFGAPPFLVPVREADNGVIVFSSGDLPNHRPFGDCDNPGCGNIVRVSGVVFPAAEDGRWVPRLKAFYTFDFPFPDEHDAPHGEVKESLTFKKR